MNKGFYKKKDEQYHNIIADEYDRVIVEPRRFSNDFIFNHFRRFLKAQNFKKGLDLGCGTGHMTLRFHKFVHSIDAIDHSKRMLDVARQNLLKSKVRNVDFYESDYKDFLKKPPNNHYDIIFCTGFIHHLKEADTFSLLTLLKKVLREGGYILFSEPQIAKTECPEEMLNWNSQALKCLKTYSVTAVEPPEEGPINKEKFLGYLKDFNLKTIKKIESWEIFAKDTNYFMNKLLISRLHKKYKEGGNILTVLVEK